MAIGRIHSLVYYTIALLSLYTYLKLLNPRNVAWIYSAELQSIVIFLAIYGTVCQRIDQCSDDRDDISGVLCQKDISKAGTNNYITHIMGCNSLSPPLIHASGTAPLICTASYYHKIWSMNPKQPFSFRPRESGALCMLKYIFVLSDYDFLSCLFLYCLI